MYMISVLKHLIHKEVCFPALKLVWDEQVDAEEFGELPKLTPSHYFNENRLTTEERHALLCRQQGKMSYCRKAGTEVVVEPPIIVFQNCQFGETYSFPIVVRNTSKNPQKVALLMDEAFAFKFDECSQRVAKFPCGMCITATITFTPENVMEDCYHRLVVSTNTTKISVPIIAIGARPMLNTPDSMVLSDAPVRYWTMKPVTVLNTGKKVANFILSATGAFCVKPEKAIVPANQAFTFEVSYFSATIGSHEGEICLKFDNGEEVYVYLKANTVTCNINLSCNDVRCDDTFMSLQTRATFFIENNSNINAKFYWKMMREPPFKQSEKNTPEKLSTSSTNIDKECEDPFESLKGSVLKDKASKNGEDGSLEVFQCDNDLVEIQNGADHLFSNDNFYVYPLFGEVKPNSKAEMHLVFSPSDCAFYEGIAYLEINGLERRLPFTFYGRGLGPKFKLGFEVLNVGDVALGGAHTYEVPVQNISEIPGTIQCDGLVGAPSGMGMKIEPLLLEVSPYQYAAFYVNFTCTGKPGFFEDEIKFSTPQTGDVFYVTVKGKITYPSIRFANPEAHMGNLSYGFPKTFYMPLVNDSMNFVDVELKMDQDGVDAPVDFNTIMKSFRHEHYRFNKNPAEFKINPTKFTLRPKGLQKVQLTIYPNEVREVRNKLNCWITDAEGNDVETVATINLRGFVIVPTLQAVKESVHLKECYLQFPYPGEFIIKNSSESPAIYCVVQKPSHHLKIESSKFVGVAEPWIETKIPFEVVCIAPGEAVAHLDLYAVGNDTKQFSLTIRCESIPSKVEASNKNVDFGKIEVLDEKILSVDIINTSPLTFPFTSACFLDEPSDKGEIWRVEPENGILPAQSRVTLMVYLLLKEVGYHYAGIRVQMTEPLKHIIEVRMKALGIGSPLLFEPNLDRNATIFFGTIFVKQEKSFEYEITNRGVNTRVLEWKPFGERGPLNRPWDSKPIAKKAPQKDTFYPPLPPLKKPKRKKEKNDETTSSKKELKNKTPLRAPFVISPLKIVLPPGGTAKLTISSYSPTPKILEEVWNLWTYVPATKGSQVDDETGDMLPPPAPKRKGHEKDKQRNKPPSNEPQNLHLRPVIINEAKLLAIFEAPGLKFSKKIMNFIIEATPTHENFVIEDSLKIENIGTLPLKVRIRTKFPFSFYQRNDDFPVEEGTYPFDTQSSTSFKVQFDGRHLRKELGVATFTGKLEAHYEGLQGTEHVELHGEVRFPQLNMDRTFIDFGTLTNGMEGVEQINVTNTGAFCLTYKWYIKPGSTNIRKNPEPAWTKEFRFDSYKPSMKQRLWKYKHRNSMLSGDFASGALITPSMNASLQRKKAKSLYEASSRDHIAQALGLNQGSLLQKQNRESNYEDFTQFLEEKMYRSRMMEFMGLKDAEYEAEDEVNYLAFYNQNSGLPKEEFNTNEIIDVIPLAGVIESGKSQTFTVVFYGYPDIDFRTSLVLYIEGGARKTVDVKGKTVHPIKQPITDF